MVKFVSIVGVLSATLPFIPVHAVVQNIRALSASAASSIASTTTSTTSSAAPTTTTASTTPGANAPPNANNTYDYVVVGSGPGGGTLAARLAQAGFSVALIDAGQDHGDDIVVEVPAFQTSSAEYTPIHWQFFVDHFEDPIQAQKDEKFTWQMPNGTFWVGPNPPAGSKPLGIYYPRTGTLGGCSQHNALITIYPHQSDWSNIANLTGDATWAPANMRKYWQKLENNQYLPAGTPGYGFSGWLDTSIIGLSLAIQDFQVVKLILGAAETFGQVATAVVGQLLSLDLNSPSPTRDTTTGLFELPISVDKVTAKRSSQRQMMLDTANSLNANGTKKFRLDIKLETLVTKILFDTSSTTPRAIGVNFITGSHLYRADPNAALGAVTGSGSFFAKREVIISGGTFNTPQLLKLSGIGPSAELASFGIPVVFNSPAVGTNMQDRYEVSVTAVVPNPWAFYAGCTFGATPDDPCLAQWLNNATNHGTYSTNLFQFMAVMNSSVSAPTEADVIIGGVPAQFYGYFPGFSNVVAGGGVTWTWLVLKAHSRNNAGTVTLTSSDPRDMPKIEFNSFQVGGDLDIQATYEGVTRAQQMLADTNSLGQSVVEQRPGPTVVGEAATKAWIKNNAWGHHASCSVPIGPANDTVNSVLDSKFRVKGVSNLRVVDASVFPKIPGFYLITAVYIMSEKAADVIITDASTS